MSANTCMMKYSKKPLISCVFNISYNTIYSDSNQINVKADIKIHPKKSHVEASPCQTVMFVCLCCTSLQQPGHLETAPLFTVPYEGREAR